MYPCKKQIVTALIRTLDGRYHAGENSILSKVDECPRKGMKTGEGYELCKSVCNQMAHAEIKAIYNAQYYKSDLKGATIFIYGHTYVCDDCVKALNDVGITDIKVLVEKAEPKLDYDDHGDSQKY